MAHGVCGTSQYASHAWASNSLCRSSQEEMGSQLSLYGTLCAAVIPCWILWAYKTSFGHGLLPFWLCHFLGLPNPTSFSPFNTIQKHNCSSSTTLLNGCHGLLPVAMLSTKLLEQQDSLHASSLDSSLAILNTHICAATNLFAWTCWDMLFFRKPCVTRAIKGMMTGLVCITPAAGLLAHPSLCSMFLPLCDSKGASYSGQGRVQFLKQLVRATFCNRLEHSSYTHHSPGNWIDNTTSND
ncbi:Ammonium transporter [Melia azedarach]|uniref:Ammonium transporter n=1 Tax=Melia azedarach TaxID=155640 RepID=A0ACC1WZA6_MELAZ|nr:Ammonium transporter [Melia azedarach]